MYYVLQQEKKQKETKFFNPAYCFEHNIYF
jgi:hypothetical protein